MKILGISFLSDASACVVIDGKLVSAVSEERLNRIKLWNGIPHSAIKTALDLAGVKLEDIDLIATHGAAPPEPNADPFLQKEKAIAAASLDPAHRDGQISMLRKRHEHEKMVLGKRTPGYLEEIRKLGKPVKIFGHHEAHAATAFYGSGWDDCLILTADGWGEDGSSTLWQGKGTQMIPISHSNTFDSLGYYYGSVTKALGFVPHRHEGKVLGLAAYCTEPKSYPVIRGMIDYDSKGKRFIGRMENGMYIPHFENTRLKEFVSRYSREDIASSVQKGLEEVVCACVKDLNGSSKIRIALAGGIFANVKLNQRIHELPNVEDTFVFPDMGDGGLAVGAAWLAHARQTGKSPAPLDGVYLGPGASDDEIAGHLKKSGLAHVHCNDIEQRIAKILADGEVVACHQGRMEFGPRALGNRSILYKATDPDVNQWLNQRLNRSEFMPFAPATLTEYADEYYIDLDGAREAARYMTITVDCTEKMKKLSPAAVHVDGTARPQIVSAKWNPRFHKILTEYHKLTGIPTLINTSYNMHEEPIVCSPDDSLRAFCASKLPYLALGNFLVSSNEEILE